MTVTQPRESETLQLITYLAKYLSILLVAIGNAQAQDHSTLERGPQRTLLCSSLFCLRPVLSQWRTVQKVIGLNFSISVKGTRKV